MSGIGPLEPGEGTHAWDTPGPDTHPEGPLRTRPAHGPIARFHERHRRASLAALALILLLAGGSYLYATRRHTPPPAPSLPPYPSQVTDISYLDAVATPPRDAGTRSFSFAVLVGVRSGPPVTVTRIAQPYAGLSVTSEPRPPFRTKAGTAHNVAITMHIKECGKVPASAGLPFLDVTLRNARAIQVHSFILGPRYAQALSQALQVACGNDFR
ncbi:Tat pathway signal sequence domain protein [Streptomyces kebangsaanensis]|uniref:Tat pathway signal sequence domain protein n=1 Tax=Streptomyces kebangsaanensis TaxID=864058 RepID=UPI00093EAB2B|nr:Tat pathway signal sequence domain protein [Streptomyces kebangsaanensis]